MKSAKYFLIIFVLYLLFSPNLYANKLLVKALEHTTAPVIERIALYDSSLGLFIERSIEFRIVDYVISSAAVGKADGFMLKENDIGKVVTKITGMSEFVNSLNIGSSRHFTDETVSMEDLITHSQAALGTTLHGLIIRDQEAEIMSRKFVQEELLVDGYFSIVYPLIQSANWIMFNSKHKLRERAQMYSSMIMLVDNATDPQNFAGETLTLSGRDVFEKFISETGYSQLDTPQMVEVAAYLFRQAALNGEIATGTEVSGMTYAQFVKEMGEGLLRNLFRIYNEFIKGEESINVIAFKNGVVSTLNTLKKIGYITPEQYEGAIKNPMRWIKNHALVNDLSLNPNLAIKKKF